MGATTTITAANLIDGMGVDTHIPYTDGGYANVAKVLSDLQYLGLSNVRDGITDGQAGSAPLSSYIALAKAGIKFTIVGDGNTSTPASIAATLGLIDRLVAAVPGSVVAVEGANEVNNTPVTFQGQTGLDGAVALQKYLYSAVHSDPHLQGVAVDDFTGYGVGSVAVGPDPSKTPGLADFDNQHPYPKWGQAPRGWLDPAQALGNEATAGRFVYTETGYTTNANDIYGVNQDVQARYLLDLYLDAAQDGSSKTYVYQLMEAYAPGSPQGDDGYGLFNPDGTAKPAATAIHDLTTILADKGTTAATFTPGTLNYSVSGLPSSGHSMAVAESDGTFDIAVWNEPQIWNNTTHVEVAAAPVAVTVQLGGLYGSVSVYDPLTGTAPVETLSNVSAVNLSITDHPLIIKLGARAASAPAVPAGPPTVAAPPPPAVSTPPAVATASIPTSATPTVAAPAVQPANPEASTISNQAVAPAPIATTTSMPASPTIAAAAPVAASVVVHADGSSTMDVQGSGQILESHWSDTFLNHGLPDNTFVFDPGHGLDIVRQFQVSGAGHDTVSLPAADFGTVAEVLRATRMVSGSAVITDPVSGDAVRLAGITKAQLAHNRADIALHA